MTSQWGLAAAAGEHYEDDSITSRSSPCRSVRFSNKTTYPLYFLLQVRNPEYVEGDPYAKPLGAIS